MQEKCKGSYFLAFYFIHKLIDVIALGVGESLGSV